MLGNDGNRLTFCDLGNCPKAPIKSGVVRLLKRSQQASTLRPTKRRIARSGWVHPDIIGSARACRKTSGNLLRLQQAPRKPPARAQDAVAALRRERDDLAKVADALAYALRYDGNRRAHYADEVMARITAEHLIRHLAQAGFVLMRAPPGAAPTTADMPSSTG
jgi:hypothetical protein